MSATSGASEDAPASDVVDPESTVEPTSSPTAAGTLEILSANSYTDSIGAHHVVGEVRNDTGQALTFVQVVATFYDADRTVVGTDFTYADLEILPPGEVSPFHIISMGAGGDIDSYRLQAEGSTSSSFTEVEFIEVVSSSTFTDSIGAYHVVGEVENTSDRALTFVQVVGTFYDAAGEVVAVDFTYTHLDTLAPGSVSPFEIIVLGSAGTPDSYRLVVQGSPQ